MKAIELPDLPQDIRALLDLASEENVVITTPDGRQFVVAEIDDFEIELKLARGHQELMVFLDHRSEDSQTLPLDEVRRQLGLA